MFTRSRPIIAFAAMFGFFFTGAIAFGQKEIVPAAIPSPFAQRGCELQLGGGFSFSQNFHDPYRPQMNDVDATVRLGWMLTNPMFSGIVRGNFEVGAELFGGAFVKGPADGLGGFTLFLTYNYLQPGWRV